MIRTLFAVGVLAVVSIVEVGRAPIEMESVTTGPLTVRYTNEVAESLASETARILSQSNMFAEATAAEISIVREDDVAVIVMPIVVDTVPPAARNAYAIYARILSDVAADSRQVVIRLTHKGATVENVSPVRALGENVFEYEQDFIYHTANLDPARLLEFAPTLKEHGFLMGDHSVLALKQLDEEYEIEVTLAKDPTDEGAFKSQTEFFDRMLSVFQTQLFEGAAVRIIGCAANHEPYDVANWYLAGFRPDAAQVTENGVTVAFAPNISENIASAVAKSLTRDGVQHVPNARVSLDKQDGDYGLTFYVNPTPEALAQLRQACTFWGQLVFSQLPNAELLRHTYVDTQNQPVLSREIRNGIGVELRYHTNYLFHDPVIPPDEVGQVQQGLVEWGVFRKESESVVLLQVGANEQLNVQLLLPEAEVAQKLGPTEINQLRDEIEATRLDELGCRVEFIDCDFNPYSNLRWDFGEADE